MTAMFAKGKLEAITRRFDILTAEMASGPEPDAYVRLSREYAELEPVVAAIRERERLTADLGGLDEMIETEREAELARMAREERAALIARLEDAEERLRVLLLPRDAADSRNVIVEIRAGTGGDEAALFAGDLFRMYSRYADLKGWSVSLLSASEGEAGGFKEAIAQIVGAGAYARLKFESGVHRVQRVPQTEAGGRIHTSAATVAVLPEAEPVDVALDEGDLKIDVYRASGAGGQHVNTTDSAVRVTHLPTGTVVACQDERSQHKNKARALTLLRARLFDAERERASAERAATRQAQVGSGDRSERIRTYNFPQGRVSDHRIGLTLHKLGAILAGDGLDEVIDALIAQHQAALLAQMETEG